MNCELNGKIHILNKYRIKHLIYPFLNLNSFLKMRKLNRSLNEIFWWIKEDL
jgi:hypothetical protein